jgi:hydrogenase expression/formation protein HypC
LPAAKSKTGFGSVEWSSGGVSRQTCLDLVPEASIGDYVLVHVGFAISRVDREEAERSYKLLESMGLLQEEMGPDGEDF